MTFNLTVNGKEVEFVQAHEWKEGLASWYKQGEETAWQNNRTEEYRFDFDLLKFVEAFYKHPHFWWSGRCNGKSFKYKTWNDFPEYKNTVPTFAHKKHEIGTFACFEFNGHRQVALETDHGPYCKERDFDLNPALKNALHFDGVHNVKYIILRRK